MDATVVADQNLNGSLEVKLRTAYFPPTDKSVGLCGDGRLSLFRTLERD
jgi:hypothetical protein